MYRIAMIDKDPDARERTHRLAADFFGQRGVSAAFVICADGMELPEYYDCYLQGDEQQVCVLRTAGENPPWGATPKPVQRERFFALLTAWQQTTDAQREDTPKSTALEGKTDG